MRGVPLTDISPESMEEVLPPSPMTRGRVRCAPKHTRIKAISFDVKFVIFCIWRQNCYLTSILVLVLVTKFMWKPWLSPASWGGRTSSNRLGTDVLNWGEPRAFFPFKRKKRDRNGTYQKKYICFQNIFLNDVYEPWLNINIEVKCSCKPFILVIYFWSSFFWPIPSSIRPFIHPFIHSSMIW